LEGANLFIVHHPNEQKDADATKATIQEKAPSVKVELMATDLSSEKNCEEVVAKAKSVFANKIDILCVAVPYGGAGTYRYTRVNNAGTQQEVEHIEDLPSEQWRHVFDVNMSVAARISGQC
jgi:NAD(P)-dependent dehydrogenase (short-subunit alcohol dehydrogenase family)